MANEEEAVRVEGTDAIHSHLRAQDTKIDLLNGRFDELNTKIDFLVDINANLKGLSEFVKRWGSRLSRCVGWILKKTATIVAPIVTIYAVFKDQIDTLIKRWLH